MKISDFPFFQFDSSIHIRREKGQKLLKYFLLVVFTHHLQSFIFSVLYISFIESKKMYDQVEVLLCNFFDFENCFMNSNLF